MKKYASGFTLIEMIIVVGIIGILASLTSAGFRGMARHQVMVTTANGLATAMARAKAAAVRDRRYVCVRISAGKYTVQQVSGNVVYYVFPQNAATTLDSAVSTSNAMSATASASDIIYYDAFGILTDGNMTPLSRVSVTLTDSLSSEVLVVSSDLLGKITIARKP